MILKQLPNALTIFRLGLIIPFLLCLLNHEYVHAFYIFILAGFTDGLDGWLARYFHWQSFVGSFIDPLADKLLVSASFLSLAYLGILPWWLTCLVLFRDLYICGGILAWYSIIKRHLDFTPSFLSKLNTILQLTLVTLCLFSLAYNQIPTYLITTLIYLTTITTCITLIDYSFTWYYKAWPKKENLK